MLHSTVKARTGRGVHNHTVLLVTAVQNYTLMEKPELWAQTPLGNPPLLFLASLRMTFWRMGEAGCDITAFSGMPFCQFTQLVGGLRYQKISLQRSTSKSAAPFVLSCKQKKGQQKATKCCVWWGNFARRKLQTAFYDDKHSGKNNFTWMFGVEKKIKSRRG